MFNTKQRYFLEKEENHIAEFCEGEKAPIVEYTYENTKGEQRKVVRIFYPQGTINKQTRFLRLKDGSSDYQTPCAEIEGVLGKVLYIDGEEMFACSSREWFKWLGAGKSKYTPNPEPKPAFNIEAVVGMQAKSINDESDLSKDAKWEEMKSGFKKS